MIEKNKKNIMVGGDKILKGKILYIVGDLSVVTRKITALLSYQFKFKLKPTNNG